MMPTLVGFNECFKTVLEQEGGWKFTNYDVPTYGGMTYDTFKAWCRTNGASWPSLEAFCIAASIKDTDDLKDVQLRSILREQVKQAFKDIFWISFRFNEPEWYYTNAPNAKLMLPVYSAAVNQGAYTVILTLQRALGVVIDGHIGPDTLKAIRDVPAYDNFMKGWRDKYIDICIAKPKHLTNLKGWLNRIDACRT